MGRLGRRTPVLPALAGLAALGLLRQSFVSGPQRLPALHGRVVARQAAEEEVPSLDSANIFITEPDAMTGELDVSGVPDGMGVYAVYSEKGLLQYIGLSKKISASVQMHADAMGLGDAPSLIASVKCLEMPGESKETLKATWQRWITEHMEGGGEIPAGNLPEGAAGADGRWRRRDPSGKQPLNLGGVSGIQSMPEAMEAVKGAIEKHPVLLFMKGTPAMPQCGFSARSVGIMNSMGVPFDTVNVLDAESNPGVREAVKQVSNWPTIPQLFVKGELIGGADIIGEMFEKGELKGLLEGADSPAAAKEPVSVGTATGTVSLIDDMSRPTATEMSRILDKAFTLNGLQIVDESAAHEGDAGALEMGLTGESHFKVEVVAPEFEGLSPVQRQQKVFTALGDLMKKVHALSLVTRTPAEVAQ